MTLRYKSASQCPDRAKHTPRPEGFLTWQTWAEKKAKTHTQHRCPTCGFWTVWKRKPRTSREAVQASGETGT